MVNSPHPHLTDLAPQVTTARLENARLSSSLSSALAFRASLLPDEGHTPAGAETGAHIQQLGEQWGWQFGDCRDGSGFFCSSIHRWMFFFFEPTIFGYLH